MTDKVKIFAYGLLQPHLQPPKSLSEAIEDTIHGDLFDLGEYPGAINVGNSANIIPGFVITIAASELVVIDEFEDLESGEYVRRLIMTHGGSEAYVYEYAWALDPNARRITQWPPS